MDMTRFEVTRLISARSLQLALGAPPLVKVDKSQSVIEAAKKEFEKKLLPLSVLRTYPSGEIKRIN